MRPVTFVLSSIALVLALFGGASAPSLPATTLASASQGAANAAAVVIGDPDGGAPKTVCVRFSEDSITGKQLLDRANAQLPSIDPVYSGSEFGSRGQAVCALCGEGCDAGDCFCQSRYWNYNVAREGAWVRSGVGLEQRTVEHGDVDGWAFGGDGAAPPFLSFAQICGQSAEPTPEPTPSAQPSPSSAPSPSAEPTAPASSPTDRPAPSPSTAAPPAASPSPEVEPAATATPTEVAAGSPDPSPTTDPAAAPAGPPSEPAAAADDPGTSDGTGVAVFVTLLAGLVGLIVWRRRSG